MERFLKFLAGYVRITIEGEQLERFLNLCRSRGISIQKVRYAGDNMLSAIIGVEDFFKLGPIRNKTRVHIRIKEKHGLPFFFYRNKKRKAFFAGVFASILILAALSSHIWNIHIQGNVINSTPEILSFLEGEGITHGISKNRINCSEIAAMVRKKYPDITWVSARMEGTRLILTVQEGETKEDIKEKGEACSIVADVEGEIVKMVTRNGIPQMKIGDVCRPGDILVLGRVDITNDSQEVVRHEYVHADADIYVRHELAYYQEFPLSYKKEVPTGKVQTSYYLKAGEWYVGAGINMQKGYTVSVEEIPWHITENFRLPIMLGTITRIQHRAEKAVYTAEQAKETAVQKLYRYEKNLLKKGMEIEENHVKIEVNETSCISRGSLIVIEKAGKETSVTREEIPTG